MPSNEGRGYVLRRIMRRAMRHGHKFGAAPTFFADLVPALVGVMGEAYPVLREKQSFIRDVLLREGEQFARTLANGMALLEEAIAKLRACASLDGEIAFRLYDTYGFPVDLTADIARERGLALDQAGFEAAMDAQRDRARAASRFGVDLRGGAELDAVTDFSGYEQVADESRVVALLKGGVAVDALAPGEEGEVVLERTPFYAESGGQVGDTGELVAGNARFAVSDTRKRGTAFSHLGRLEGGTLARRQGRRQGRRRAPRTDPPQPHGHASAARGAARGAGHARAAEGLAGRAGSAALRLRALPARDARGAARASSSWSTTRSASMRPPRRAR